MRYFTALAATIVLGLAGCQQEMHSTPNAEGPTGVFRSYAERDVAAREYRVAPPDKLAIKAPGIKELNDLTTIIRPDGRISVNLLGEVYVTNKTPEEIGKQLTDLATKYYNNPEIRVEVTEFNSKAYALVGTPTHDPGRKNFTGRNTVLDAITQAKLTDDAWPQQVMLSRPGKSGQQNATAVIDFKHMVMTGDMRQNYLLEEGDILFVRNSPLAEWRRMTTNIAGPVGTAGGAVQAVTPMGVGTGKP